MRASNRAEGIKYMAVWASALYLASASLLFLCCDVATGACSGVARLPMLFPLQCPSLQGNSVMEYMFPTRTTHVGFFPDLYYSKLMISQTQTDQQSRDLSPAVNE